MSSSSPKVRFISLHLVVVTVKGKVYSSLGNK